MKDVDAGTPEVGARSVLSRRVLLFCAITIFGCIADLWTKHLAFQRLGEPGPGSSPGDHLWWLVDGYFGFQTAVNTGAVWGIFQGGSHWFAAISIVAGAGILTWLFCFGAARDLLLTVALGCVAAGILGNLYDRLGFWEHSFAPHAYGVRDWILMQIPGYGPWPNYNIADVLLVSGAGMLMWHAIRYREEVDQPKKQLAVSR